MRELRFRLWEKGEIGTIAEGSLDAGRFAAALSLLLPAPLQAPTQPSDEPTNMGQLTEDRLLKEALENQVSYSDARGLDAEKHNTNALSGGTVDGFEVAVAGNVAVVTGAGNARTLAVSEGRIYPLRITHLKVTGTTATGVVGYTL
jgi:hypothetical protein